MAAAGPPIRSWVRPYRDIGACTVGLVGYGSIAKKVANIVEATGATVLHTSTRDDGLPGWRPLSELSPASGRCPQAASEVGSLHVPLTADTEGLIDRAAIAGMQPAAVLVNTSRGPIVDENALAEALRDGRLAAAGLDVFGVEPVPPENPLLGLDNVVLTPHVTWYTVDTMRRWLTQALNNPATAVGCGDGQQLAHVVNQPTGC
jgi:phosphoglycerate dehydrogenase-like enzyme